MLHRLNANITRRQMPRNSFFHGNELRTTLGSLLLCFLLGIGPAHAQQEQPAQPPSPTYRQTVAWILSKTNQLGWSGDTNGNTFSYAYSDVSIHGCVLSYHVAYESGDFGYWDEDVSIPMESDISGSEEGDSAGFWRVWLGSDSQSIRVWGAHADSGSTYRFDRYTASNNSDTGVSDWVFGEPNSDHKNISDRMVKALNYLAGLCKAPAPKEPF